MRFGCILKHHIFQVLFYARRGDFYRDADDLCPENMAKRNRVLLRYKRSSAKATVEH